MLQKRMKELRLLNRYTQEQLARMIGVDRTSVGKYETSNVIPSVDILLNLADVLGTSIDYLLGNTDDPTPPAKKGQKKEAPEEASEDVLRFALFGDVSEEISDAEFEDVKRYAEFIAQKKRKENSKE